MVRAARLKVYLTSAGFEDALVAAPSQAAALKAWGARGDLFALGEASVVTDPKLATEPLACPGEVIRRPRGDMAAVLAAAPKAANVARGVGKAPGGVGAASTPPPLTPDRSALNAAEKALAARERLAHELEAIAQERAVLDRQERRTRETGVAELKRLERVWAEAKLAYSKTGGA